MHWVHYAVAGVETDKPLYVSLDQATQGRNVHVRAGFSFQDHKTSMCVPGPAAFARNIQGHVHPCTKDKQVWCRLDDVVERAHAFAARRNAELAWTFGG